MSEISMDRVIVWNGLCYIYVAQSNFGLIKIGITTNPNQRLIAIQNQYASENEIFAFVYLFQVRNVEVAQRVEQMLHQYFDDFRVENEIFDLAANEVIRLLRFAVKFSDFSSDMIFDPPEHQFVIEVRKEDVNVDEDEYMRAVELFKKLRKGSISLLQRQLRFGYRKSRLYMDRMIREGVFDEMGLAQVTPTAPYTPIE